MLAKFISDPREGALGCVLQHRSSERETRSAFPLFQDDPFQQGRKPVHLPEQVSHEGFELKIGADWVLDGHRAFIHPEGKLFAEKVMPPDYRDWQHLFGTDPDTKLRWDESAGGYYYPEELFHQDVQMIEGKVGIAVSVEPSNWGSFLCRILPRVMLMQEEGCERYFFYCAHPKQKEMLEVAGIDMSRVIEQNVARRYRFASGVLYSEPTQQLYINRQARAMLRQLARNVSEPVKFKKRIYISRRSGVATKSGRTCLNEAELETALEREGFDIIQPDQLTVRQQVEQLHQASMVVGCSGAGMFNTVFCEAGTQVIDIESRPNWIYGHANLFSSLKHQYGFIWAQPDDPDGPPHSPFQVDVDAVIARVKLQSNHR